MKDSLLIGHTDPICNNFKRTISKLLNFRKNDCKKNRDKIENLENNTVKKNIKIDFIKKDQLNKLILIYFFFILFSFFIKIYLNFNLFILKFRLVEILHRVILTSMLKNEVLFLKEISGP